VETFRISRIRPWSFGLCLVTACLALARPATAQPTTQADALFQQGLSDMQAGNYESGCPRLAESHRLDPSPGALFTLAECEAAWTKVATAIEHYQAFVDVLTSLPAARRDRFDERRRIALEKIAALSSTAPEITVDVSAAAAASLSVKRDGQLVEPSSYGVGRKVDPGQYVFTAEVDGRTVWERTVRLSLQDRAQIQVPWPVQEELKTVAAPSEPITEAAPGTNRKAPLRVLTYVSGGVGIAGLAAGIVAGGLALGKKNIIEKHCPGRLCDAEGRSAVESGQRAALVSTLGFAVGLAGAAAATTLLLLRRSDARPVRVARYGLSPALLSVRAGAGVGVEGSFP
jgi:hypothetical protein